MEIEIVVFLHHIAPNNKNILLIIALNNKNSYLCALI